MSIDVMCNSLIPRSTEKTKSNNRKVEISCISKVQGNQQQQQQQQGTRSNEDNRGVKILPLTPSSVESCSPLPYIPFSKTFGKSEETFRGRKGDRARLSLDSQQSLRRRFSDGERPLRRRARSSEGCILRHHRIDYFEKEESDLDTTNNNDDDGQEQEQINFSSLMKNAIRRRKKHRSPSPRNTQQSSESSNDDDEPDKVRRHASVIPADHPFKIIWDVLTVILSVAHSYLTHMAIRDRKFEPSPFISFCQAWFLVDILLNFFTERKTNTGEIISDHRRIVARYLTSWFAVDILSLFPWEILYVKPLIEIQNRRGFFKKSFFRSKAVIRVVTHLRGQHFRWFGTAAKHSKHHGIRSPRLLRLIIKYLPKYIMFLRNMKGIVAMRFLRFVHWSRRSIKNIEGNVVKQKPSDASTKSMSTTNTRGGDDDNSSLGESDDNSEDPKKQVEIYYDWEKIKDEDDDDDGVSM